MIPVVGVCSRCRSVTNASVWPFLLSICIGCFREYLRSFQSEEACHTATEHTAT